MTYKLNIDHTQLTRLEDGASIPLVLGNRDFNEAYEVLTAAGLLTELPDGKFSFLIDNVLLTCEKGPSLEDIKQTLINKIDEAAGNIRGMYITTSKGQESTYAEKSVEFELYVSKGSPRDFTPDTLGIGFYTDADDRKYYYVAAEVTAMGFDPATATAEEVQHAVDNVLLTKAAWTQINAAIENLRLGGKLAVKAAQSVEAANAKADEVFAKLIALTEPQ